MARSASANLLVCILLYATTSLAQTPEGRGGYFSITVSIANRLSAIPRGTMAASIPYTSTDALGNVTSSHFATSHPGIYNKAVDFYQSNNITLEGGSRTFFVNYKFAGNCMSNAGVISAGKRIQLGNNFAVKVSLGIGFVAPWKFNIFSTGYDSLGSIDNTNKTISILGKTFNPTFTDSQGQLQNANQLSVYYSQRNISLIPRISFGQSDFRHFYYWDFFIEYQLPVSKMGEINLYQNNSGPGKEVTLSKTSNYVTYNGSVAGKVPPVFNGFYAGFTLGISLSPKDRNYHRQRPSNHMSKQRHSTKRRTKRSSKKKQPEQNNKGEDSTRGW